MSKFFFHDQPKSKIIASNTKDNLILLIMNFIRQSNFIEAPCEKKINKKKKDISFFSSFDIQKKNHLHFNFTLFFYIFRGLFEEIARNYNTKKQCIDVD